VIARRFGVSESSLARANNIRNKNKIRAGQNLKIPGKTSNRGIGADLSDYLQFTYTVKSGDTLDAIASKFNTTSDAIALANGLKNRNRINAGRIIAIPGLRPKIDLKNASEVSYIVKTGDTLGRIARYYNTTVTTLAKTNGISINDTIYPGQKLRITNAN
jgi:LysM repeat protein